MGQEDNSNQSLLTPEMKIKSLSGLRVLSIRNERTGEIMPTAIFFGKEFQDYEPFVNAVDGFKRSFYENHGLDKDGLTLEDRWVQDMSDFRQNYPDLQPRFSPSRAENLMEITDPLILKGRLLKMCMGDPELTAGEGLYFVSKALKKAEVVHADHTRREGAPYIVHPLRVAQRVYEAGYKDADSLAISILHDVLEDSDTPMQELETEFSLDVANGVKLLSRKTVDGEVDSVTYFERLKGAPQPIRAIKVYDRVDNLLSLNLTQDPPEVKKAYVDEAKRYILPLAQGVPQLEQALDQAIQAVVL